MGQHVMYWQGQLERGAAVLFGPVDDPAGAWGLAIIQAGTIDDAHTLAASDPAVTSGTCTYEIFPMEAIVRSAG